MKQSAAWPFPTSDNLAVIAQEPTTQEYLLSEGLQIFHDFEPGTKGGVTVAFRKTSENVGCRMVEVSVVYCSPHDVFSRKTGTKLVLDNWKAGKRIMIPARYYGCDYCIIPNLKLLFSRNCVVQGALHS